MNLIKLEEYNVFKYEKLKGIELKEICKYYNLKRTGKKIILIERIYKFLKETYNTLKIQKCWRSYLLNKLNNYKGGIVLLNRKCVNEYDFLTMDKIRDIDYKQFFSIKCVDGLSYGFDIISIYNLFMKSCDITKNPYNRNPISKKVFKQLTDVIKISKFLNLNVNIKLEEEEITDPYQKMNTKCLIIFQKINELGNYSQMEWFISLDKQKLIYFIKELYDIWYFRASLSERTRRDICSDVAPFRQICFYQIILWDKLVIQDKILNVIDLLVDTGVNINSKVLGAYYVLSALTLVNKEAAISMPWLYQSVAIR